MSVYPRLAFVLPFILLLAPAALVGQVATEAAPEPAVQQPADGIGPKNDAFNRLFAEWTDLMAQLRKLTEEYRTADADRQTEIREQHGKSIEKGDVLMPQVMAAAEQAYAEAPNANQRAAEFLAEMVTWRCQSDEYEEALELATKLIKNEIPNKSVHAWAGIAAFLVGQYDDADNYFKTAEKADALKVLGGREQQFRPDLDYYKKAWKKEQEIRAAEAKADDLPRVLLKTNKGDVTLELFENEAPNTVANFISLVEKGYYDGITFHRVLPGFMAQGGCPEGTGSGGPGYTIKCECTQPNYRVHFRGSLSMAKTALPDTGGSQFFLNFIPTKQLDGKHTAFGRVVDGIDVLAKIQRRNPQYPNQPKPDRILEAKVLRKRPHQYQPVTIPE